MQVVDNQKNRKILFRPELFLLLLFVCSFLFILKIYDRLEIDYRWMQPEYFNWIFFYFTRRLFHEKYR